MSERAVPAVASEPWHDFDLFGIVGIRLVDAAADDVARVRRLLGPFDAPLEREPDISVRWVDHLEAAPLTYVGYGDCGFDDDGFYVLCNTGRGVARARVPFDRLGDRPEIVCERSMPAVPHLSALINLTALGKGVLPVHASAWVADGLGVLATGWSKGGRSESLLAAMNNGADYLGNGWVYLTADGGMCGLQEPIRLWWWHLRQLPAARAGCPGGDRARVEAWRRLAATMVRFGESRLPGSGLARRGGPMLQRQACLYVPPADLFGTERLSPCGRVDTALLVTSHEPGTTVSGPAETGEIAARMRACLVSERGSFLDHYQQFRFAFPGARSRLVDQAAETERGLLVDRLDHLPAARISHDYPVDIAALGRVVDGAARKAAAGSAAIPDADR